MAEAPGGPARRDAALDLGWCAGSAVLPRKQHAIQGVGASSIVALQAQLYRTQEAARSSAQRDDGGDALAPRPGRLAVAPRSRDDGGGALGGTNAGVAQRAARDEAASAAAAVAPERVAAALERKAALYDRLQREGGGEDASRGDMDARYNVDFVMKPREGAWAHDRYAGDEAPYDEAPYEAGRPRRREADEAANAEEAAEVERRRAARAAAHEAAAATTAGRDQAAAERQRRAAAEGAERERLRKAFLKDTAAKLRAAQAAQRKAKEKAAAADTAAPQTREETTQ